MFEAGSSTATELHPKTSYRPEIDGLRALAVIAVIINHFNKDILPSGYLGVDIFFVISGFVITSSLAGRASKDFSDFLTGFYIRRIKRLVPALVLFAISTGLLICLFNPTPEVSLKSGIASLFGFSNLYLFNQATDYFATAAELNVFTHTWSLGVEEQFYVLFPLLVWSTGFGRLTAGGAKNLFITIGTLSVVSLFSFVYLYGINQPAAYFLMPTRLWELGTGCLLFLGLGQLHKYRRILESISPTAITIAIIVVLWAPLRFAVPTTIAVVILTAVLIACIRPGTAAYSLFTQKHVVYIGLVSYSLYLWHWSILSISRWTVGIYWWTAPFQLALMILICSLSYKYIEAPLRQAQWSFSRLRSIGYGLLASFTASLFMTGLYFNAQHLSLYDENKEISYKSHWSGWGECDYVKSSHPDYGRCRYLDNKDYSLRVVVFGDSHAGHLASGLKEISPNVPASFAVVLYKGCYPIQNAECSIIRDGYRWVLDNPEVDLVILAAYHNLTTHQNRLYEVTEDPNAMPDGSLSIVEKELRASIDVLTASGKWVLMIVDSHELLLDPELEIIPMSGMFREPGLLDVSHQPVIERNKSYYDMLDRLASENPRFKVFYSGSVFCDDDVCKSDINGKPLFQSRDHLTPYGSEVLALQYQDIIVDLLANP